MIDIERLSMRSEPQRCPTKTELRISDLVWIVNGVASL